jgi:hypothetical protein
MADLMVELRNGWVGREREEGRRCCWCSVVAVKEKRLDLQAPPEGKGGLLRACGRCCCCHHRWGRSWRRRRCDEETLLLRRSEEGAGSPLSSSLAPATEREKKLWFKGHRKMGD